MCRSCRGKKVKVDRYFTKKGKGPYAGIQWESRASEIRNPNGEVIFSQRDVVVPSFWSQIATDIMAQKYFRKTGIPEDKRNAWRSFVPAESQGIQKRKRSGEEKATYEGENDSRQVFHRLAYTWMLWGKKAGYFMSEEDAEAFYDETCYMLAHQLAAPNSPQWFNTGLHAVYGISGPPQGHFFVNPETLQVERSKSAYERPQPHACFILNVEDDLVNPGGIMDLVTREARLFKYGSGSGTNFSRIRAKSEPLSGGGISSGLLSFLKVADRSASAVKSGGTTRRAAKMVTLDIDHPDVEQYINWKVEEEYKVACLAAGSDAILKAVDAIKRAVAGGDGQSAFDPELNRALRAALADAIEAGVPRTYLYQILKMLEQGDKQLEFPRYTTAWDDEAYNTVSGQSSNNSLRVTNAFMEAVLSDGDFALTARTTGEPVKTLRAQRLWDAIVRAAWICADPGLQFHTTINEWHTCPADGEIRASNPCSEYMFLDDTACNLASLNLMAFYDAETGIFDMEGYIHAVHIWTLILEISVVMAQFPSEEIAKRSYDYRTLGLGYANLGSLLMVMGIPYDSPRGRAIAGALTAVLTGEAYVESARMASEFGPFRRYEANRNDMLKVIRNHRRAAYNAKPSEYEGLSITPQGIDPADCSEQFMQAARSAWDEALKLGEMYGFRNAQVSAIAPTGTIGLLMDCDTTGIEPDFALVKFKKLAGGGFFKIINSSVPPALRALGYTDEEVKAITTYCLGRKTLKDAPGVSLESLEKNGFTDEALRRVEAALPDAFNLESVFTPSVLGGEFLEKKLKVPAATYTLSGFSLLRHLGYSEQAIEEADTYACGTMGLEGAPFLKEEHQAVFDTATPSGKNAQRSIRWEAHILMMASVQPFVSGAISKTINMPFDATYNDVKGAYLLSWKTMNKSIALYRDGSKLSQPLSSLASGKDPLADFLASVRKENGEAQKGAEEPAKPPLSRHGTRLLLPNRRKGYTQKAKIGGHSIFLRTGEYEDGSLGEIFLDMHKEGAAFRSLLNSFAIAVSLGLQYGVPLEEYVDAFVFSRFEPNGIVQGHDYVKMTTSVIDFIFRDLAISYLKRTDLGQVKPADLVATATNGDSAVMNGDSGKTEPNVHGGETAKDQTVNHRVESEAVGEVRRARVKGYEGDPCPSCGHLTLVRNGTCLKCETCGSTTGCS